MTAPVKTQDGSQPPQPTSTTESGNGGTSATSGTQPTNPPTPSPTDVPSRDYVQALQDQLRINTQQLAQRERELAEARQASTTRATAEPTVTEEEYRQQFYNNPKAALDGVKGDIIKELREVIKPFESYIQEGRVLNAFENAKGKLRSDPRFSTHWDANIETAVDFLVRSAAQSGQQLNDQSLVNIVTTVIGQKLTGQLPVFMLQYGLPYQQQIQSQPNPNPNPPSNDGNTNVNQNNPPYLRPTPAPQPQAPAGRTKREPNENERRIMRENNIKTVDEYDWWLQLKPADVATAKYPGEGKW